MNGDVDGAFYQEEPAPIHRDDAHVPALDQDEVRTAIIRLRNNKAPGADVLPDELFKASGIIKSSPTRHPWIDNEKRLTANKMEGPNTEEHVCTRD